MNINTSHRSPNFAATEIPVEFLVLHYTACDLEKTLAIFRNPEPGVCAHFVIDLDGCIYDLGGFTNGPIRRGAHAGKSRLEVQGTTFEAFNQFSVGIEMINRNGNLVDYTQAQYESLAELVRHLQKRFPALQDPERIVGHEHIAHWRGKADPGVRFAWGRFLTSVGLIPTARHAFFACDETDLAWLRSQGEVSDWAKLSSELESRIARKNA